MLIIFSGMFLRNVKFHSQLFINLGKDFCSLGVNVHYQLKKQELEQRDPKAGGLCLEKYFYTNLEFMGTLLHDHRMSKDRNYIPITYYRYVPLNR